jgi:plastocyanin
VRAMKSLLAILALLGLALSGCTSTPGDQAGTGTTASETEGAGSGPEMEDGKYVVRLVSGNKFDPADLTIPAGSTVVWVTDSGVHDVTEGEAGSEESEWSSEDDGPKMTPGVRYERTFNETGTVHYRCVLHESGGMVGTLTVT